MLIPCVDAIVHALFANALKLMPFVDQKEDSSVHVMNTRVDEARLSIADYRWNLRCILTSLCG